MSSRTLTARLRSETSVFAISAVALIGAAALQPAFATNSFTTGLYGGGSTLFSLSARQSFDCYMGATVGTGTGADGYSFSSSFDSATPTPGLLPTTCTSISTGVEGLYAGVGSGAGLRAFIDNSPLELFNAFLPAIPPQYIDNNNTSAAFNTYPYPRIDFGAGDSPFPANIVATTAGGSVYSTNSYTFATTTNWTSTVATTFVTSVSYSTASFGAPIQLPIIEAVVDVAVNLPVSGSTVNGVTWEINSQNATPTSAGGAIQLTAAQVCAIFSGLVTDWSDTTTLIPYLDDLGVQHTTNFYTANTPGTPAAYASESAPINVVYRSDGSGTSFIMTNYLKTVCPLLDPSNTYGYQSIFNISSLPNNSFSQVLNAVNAWRTANSSTTVTNWIGTSGSANVSAAIGNAANSPTTQIGNIGYLSNDFVAPYNAATTAPQSASLQNEYLRGAGVYTPGTGTQAFIAPTPANADEAWGGLTAPLTTATYAAWNPYAQTITTTATQYGVDLFGLSILPLYNAASAYPLSGTTFLYAYSCYGTGVDGTAAATRVTTLTNWLSWVLGASQSNLAAGGPSSSTRSAPKYDTDLVGVIQNNGFNVIPSGWAAAAQAEFLTTGLANQHPNAIEAIVTGTQTRGCSGVTGGAS